MLGYEHRMPTPWGLLAVIQGSGGSKALRDEIACVGKHRGYPAIGQICALLIGKPKAAAERRRGELREHEIEITHDF